MCNVSLDFFRTWSWNKSSVVDSNLSRHLRLECTPHHPSGFSNTDSPRLSRLPAHNSIESRTTSAMANITNSYNTTLDGKPSSGSTIMESLLIFQNWKWHWLLYIVLFMEVRRIYKLNYLIPVSSTRHCCFGILSIIYQR